MNDLVLGKTYRLVYPDGQETTASLHSINGSVYYFKYMSGNDELLKAAGRTELGKFPEFKGLFWIPGALLPRLTIEEIK